ncbi:MAG: DHH family phosphoesterase, partial [Planctomycetes bacterium]|nr:DHH family phosphoesterase [Planctomycetota bacterium]
MAGLTGKIKKTNKQKLKNKKMPAGMPTTIKPNKRQEKSQKKLWVIQPPTAGVGQLAKSLKVAPLTAQILANRGITKIEKATKFLRPKLTQLIEPEKMPGVKEAVKRIKTAIENKEKITIYGDYDVDGITSVAILVSLLTLLGADADYYIPHRIDEGYGLNNEAIESLAKNGSKLIVTVDCGINSMQAAEFAGQFGIELIITDHHQPSDQLPQAAAIVHPAIEDSYANQDSAGAMVAYKLAWAIANEFTTGGSTKLTTGKKLSSELRDFMLSATSLAAMGTVADVMDLRGENRVLTSYGLKALPECNLCGVTALIESAGLAGKELDSFHIGFRLAPLINAAGRMGHARLAVELLISTSETHSMEIAQYLKSQNSQRQKCERKILSEVCEIIDKNGLAKADKKS